MFTTYRTEAHVAALLLSRFAQLSSREAPVPNITWITPPLVLISTLEFIPGFIHVFKAVLTSGVKYLEEPHVSK